MFLLKWTINENGLGMKEKRRSLIEREFDYKWFFKFMATIRVYYVILKKVQSVHCDSDLCTWQFIW